MGEQDGETGNILVILQLSFSSGENAGLVDECRHVKWSRDIIESCMKITKNLAKDKSEVNMQ